MKLIEHRFAKTGDGRHIDIREVDPDNRHGFGDFFCIGCDGRMVAALGQKVVHHFRHKHDAPNCSRESYLHNTAKHVLAKAISDAIATGKTYPLLRPQDGFCDHQADILGEPCDRPVGPQTIDLAQFFDTVEIERGIDGFVADVLLSGTAGHMLLEIEVTHACEPEKIDSGLKIVEVKIEDEDDIDRLRDGLVDLEKTITHNFRPRRRVQSNCKRGCARFSALIINDKGEPERLEGVTHALFKAKVNSPSTVYSQTLSLNGMMPEKVQAWVSSLDLQGESGASPLPLWKVACLDAIHNHGIQVKSCEVCKYFRGGNCRLYSRDEDVLQARSCAFYAFHRPRNLFDTAT